VVENWNVCSFCVHTESFLQKLEQGWNIYQQRLQKTVSSYLLQLAMVTAFFFFFFVSTNLYCFLQQNYSPDLFHVARCLRNQSCSYVIPQDIKIWIFKGRFHCGPHWMCIAWPYGHTRLLRVNILYYKYGVFQATIWVPCIQDMQRITWFFIIVLDSMCKFIEYYFEHTKCLSNVTSFSRCSVNHISNIRHVCPM
jgi:hypothetical protein